MQQIGHPKRDDQSKRPGEGGRRGSRRGRRREREGMLPFSLVARSER
jgi:hypothetical protein